MYDHDYDAMQRAAVRIEKCVHIELFDEIIMMMSLMIYARAAENESQKDPLFPSENFRTDQELRKVP